MSRAGRAGHLLGSRLRELADTPTEVILRGAATHARALVSGLAFVDAKLKADREPIRAMAAEAVKLKRADARAKSKADRRQQGARGLACS